MAASVWRAVVEPFDPPVVGRLRLRVSADGELLTFGALIRQLTSCRDFRLFFSRTLAEVCLPSFLFEVPGLEAQSLRCSFECAVVDSPLLGQARPDRLTFKEHFDNSRTLAVSFPNLSGDAMLVAPTPGPSPEAYSHLAAFCRLASPEQLDAFWRLAAEQWGDSLASGPVWCNANGLGVAWLHLRLDRRAKYYVHSPYRGLLMGTRNVGPGTCQGSGRQFS